MEPLNWNDIAACLKDDNKKSFQTPVSTSNKETYKLIKKEVKDLPLANSAYLNAVNICNKWLKNLNEETLFMPDGEVKINDIQHISELVLRRRRKFEKLDTSTTISKQTLQLLRSIVPSKTELVAHDSSTESASSSNVFKELEREIDTSELSSEVNENSSFNPSGSSNYISKSQINESSSACSLNTISRLENIRNCLNRTKSSVVVHKNHSVGIPEYESRLNRIKNILDLKSSKQVSNIKTKNINSKYKSDVSSITSSSSISSSYGRLSSLSDNDSSATSFVDISKPKAQSQISMANNDTNLIEEIDEKKNDYDIFPSRFSLDDKSSEVSSNSMKENESTDFIDYERKKKSLTGKDNFFKKIMKYVNNSISELDSDDLTSLEQSINEDCLIPNNSSNDTKSELEFNSSSLQDGIQSIVSHGNSDLSDSKLDNSTANFSYMQMDNEEESEVTTTEDHKEKYINVDDDMAVLKEVSLSGDDNSSNDIDDLLEESPKYLAHTNFSMNRGTEIEMDLENLVMNGTRDEESVVIYDYNSLSDCSTVDPISENPESIHINDMLTSEDVHSSSSSSSSSKDVHSSSSLKDVHSSSSSKDVHSSSSSKDINSSTLKEVHPSTSQDVHPSISKDLYPSILEDARPSTSKEPCLTVDTNVAPIPVFNDLDLETEDEDDVWDAHVEPEHFFNRGQPFHTQLDKISDVESQNTDISDTNLSVIDEDVPQSLTIEEIVEEPSNEIQTNSVSITRTIDLSRKPEDSERLNLSQIKLSDHKKSLMSMLRKL